MGVADRSSSNCWSSTATRSVNAYGRWSRKGQPTLTNPNNQLPLDHVLTTGGGGVIHSTPLCRLSLSLGFSQEAIRVRPSVFIACIGVQLGRVVLGPMRPLGNDVWLLSKRTTLIKGNFLSLWCSVVFCLNSFCADLTNSLTQAAQSWCNTTLCGWGEA